MIYWWYVLNSSRFVHYREEHFSPFEPLKGGKLNEKETGIMFN